MNPWDMPSRLSWFDDLLSEVDVAFEALGAQTPGWPAPHPDRRPLQEEYSRLLDPGKYAILGTRLDAWARVLADADLAETEDEHREPWIAGRRPVSELARVRRMRPARPGALSLVVATTLVDGLPFGLDLGVARDGELPVLLTVVPDCGCDACDDGSAVLLEDLDGWVLTVARGGVVHARSGDDSITRSVNGWSASGEVQVDWLVESQVAAGVTRWSGVAWR